MITKEQYLAAKKIVDEYEHEECMQSMIDDLDDDEPDEDYDEMKEREEEENLALAYSCTCGAWVVGKDGKGHHVADCCCGAE